MIKLIGNFKNVRYVACSGGVDSMAALSFIKQSRSFVLPAFFHHRTETSEEAFHFLRGVFGTSLVSATISGSRPPGKSIEHWWRDERYAFLETLGGEVVTAHHLNDVAETYLFSSMHGVVKTIPYRRNNVIRPFLLTEKKLLERWARTRNVQYIEDETNKDISYPRNRIRHIILPEVFKINPGFLKVVARRVRQDVEQHI